MPVIYLLSQILRFINIGLSIFRVHSLSISSNRKMKTILIILISTIFVFESCTQTEVPQGSKKVTYRVSGTEYNVLLKYPNGEKELIYNQTNVLKRYAHANAGDQLYVLAYGDEDLQVTIIVDGEVDTVRKASTTGTDLVLIDTRVKE